MDLNPDEAIAAGWLNPKSMLTRLLDRMSRFSLTQSEQIIVLDRFMEARILGKGVPPQKIAVLPPWSHDDDVEFNASGRNQFRATHGLENKFVVMYSGNHSPCHPLDTLLEAARAASGVSPAVEPGLPAGRSLEASAADFSLLKEIVLCFIGGGSEFAKVKAFAKEHNLSNILCLPYEPLDQLSASLSAADLHVVVMGNPFVGTIHPCKIYNILRVGAPVLYIGPKASHVSEILEKLDAQFWGSCRHGATTSVLEAIQQIRNASLTRPIAKLTTAAQRFSQSTLLPKMIELFKARPHIASSSSQPTQDILKT
jgi:colanic acid biosynthesis glycosyl transferase WcaI